MRCRVRVSREGTTWVARCDEFADATGRGATREEALDRVRRAVVFWLEACPCDQTATPGLEFEVIEAPSSR
jgi:predicted RNase H-like HicB family nuclease